MGRHRAPLRARPVVPALGASAGALGLAALVAALDPVAVPTAGGTTSAASAPVDPVASDAPWMAGPLELPGIGVVAPDFEAAYEAHAAAPPAVTTAPPAATTEAPAPPPPSVPATPTADGEDLPTVQAAAPAAPARTRPPASPAIDEPAAPPTGSKAPPLTEEPPPPPDEPPTDEPPTDEPPTEEPAGEEAPVDEPAADEPPADEPPADEPPADEPPADEPPADEPPADEPPADEPAVVADLTIGQGVEVLDPETGAVAATVVVDEIVVDVTCTAEGSTVAVNGHLVGVRVRLTTGPSVPGGLELGAASFTVVDDLGTPAGPAATPAAEACLTDAEAFPSEPLAAGRSYDGVVVFDVPTTTGTVTYRPGPAAAGGRWAF